MISLYNGNCFNLIKTIDDNSIDLVLTDPPYEFKPGGFGGGQQEISKRSLKQDINNEKLHQVFDVTLLDEFVRVCKRVNFVIFGTEIMMNKIMNWCEQYGYTYTLTVWNKTNPTPLCNNRYLNNIEFIIHVREKGVLILGDYYSKQKVYTSPVNKTDKDTWGHPTIKPVELIAKYLTNHSKEGDMVLDCFMGSGTTGVACKLMNRNFIGIELDENYYKICEQRINRITSDTALETSDERTKTEYAQVSLF